MTNEQDFNEDMACERTREIWLRIAKKIEDDAMNETVPLFSMEKAMMADACYWQATGAGGMKGKPMRGS